MRTAIILLLVALAALLGDCSCAAADAIPANRRAYSFAVVENVGVTGDIPVYTGLPVYNVMSYGGNDTGTAYNDAAFAAAIADKTATIGSARALIKFPAGVFKVTSLLIPISSQGIIIVGDGKGVTSIRPTGNVGISISGATDFANPANVKKAITGGLTAGSTVINFANASGFVVSRMAKILLTNESITPIVSVYGYTNVRTVLVFVTAVDLTANTVTISRPIPLTYPAEAVAGAQLVQNQYTAPRNNGVCDLTIDCADSPLGVFSGVDMTGAVDSFVRRVEVKNHKNYGIFTSTNISSTVRECEVGPGNLGTTNTSGLVVQDSAYVLAESNYLLSNNPSIQVNFGTTASVFADNYVQDIKANHGPHNSGNLYTRNCIKGFFNSDGYFGGLSDELVDGNFFENGSLGGLKRFSRRISFSRNIVGTPGQTYTTDGSEGWGMPHRTDITYYGTAKPSTGDWWQSWDTSTGYTRRTAATLTTRTTATSGVITMEAGGGVLLQAHMAAAAAWNAAALFGISLPTGATAITASVTSIVGDVVTFYGASQTMPAEGASVIIVPSPNGFTEFDEDVAATTLRKGNYYVLTGNIPAGEALGADTMPLGYDRTTKPAAYGNLAWPPFDAANPGTPSITDIPPGFYAVNGYWPSDDEPEEPPSATMTADSLTTGTVNFPP